MTAREKLKHCAGCRNNFYNGHNPYGIEECWSLKEAKLILRKRVGVWRNPPWTQKAEKYLDCRHEAGYVFVGKDQTQ